MIPVNTTFHHLLRLINYLQIIARLDQRSAHTSTPHVVMGTYLYIVITEYKLRE